MIPMHILVTGGTGFIGQALCEHLLSAGHRLTILSRDPCRAERRLLSRVHAIASVAELADDDGPEAVINLAGAPLPGKRWTERYKAVLRDSRIGLTHRLIEALAGRGFRPRIWLNASAIGYYGDTGLRPVNETEPAGSDFAARLCRDWEAAAARAAEVFDARVACVRIGIVLGPGGALKAMLPAFRLGLGGPLGSGDQIMSWIHRDDLVALFVQLLGDDQASGVYNGTAPNPVSNREFARTLARSLRRPAWLTMPAPILRLLVGEMAELLLTGQMVLPERALAAGYHFRFPLLSRALDDLYDGD